MFCREIENEEPITVMLISRVKELDESFEVRVQRILTEIEEVYQSSRN